jgi:hypothetical protein
MRLRPLLGLALLVLATAAAPARADPLTPEQKAAVEAQWMGLPGTSITLRSSILSA